MPALSYLFRVLIVGRDAGEAEKLIKIFEMTLRAWVDGSDAKAFVIPRASSPLAVALCEGGRDSRGKTLK